MPDVQSPADPHATAPTAAPDASTTTPPLDYDPIAHLKKMSTTAGVGSQDYVAINPLAVASLLLGLATVLVLLTDVLFLLPLAGVICAVAAIRQVNDSNGTQAGKGWALLGLALSVLIGGGVLGSRALAALNGRQDTRQIAGVIDELGRAVVGRSYGDAYALFTPDFQRRVTRPQFEARLQELNAVPELGALRSMRWNGRVQFDYEDAPEGTTRLAAAVALLEFERGTQPNRQQLLFVKQGDRWLIEDYAAIFPREQPSGRKAPQMP